MLSGKLVMLMALLYVDGITKEHVTVEITSLLKQSEPPTHVYIVKIPALNKDRRVCVFTLVKENMKRTKNIRTGKNCLWLATLSPHKEVSRETISRWLRDILQKA